MLAPSRCAARSKVTDLVTPWRVRSPVAFVLTTVESDGTVDRTRGWVSLNAAVGNFDVSMIRLLNWPSRWLWSLLTVFMLTVRSTVLTVDPSMTSDPVMSLVRPTASLDWPNSVSFTRYPRTDAEVGLYVTAPAGAGAAVVVAVVAAVVVELAVAAVVAGDEVWLVDPALSRVSGAGAVPSMKWM